jgi:hypothetical protein
LWFNIGEDSFIPARFQRAGDAHVVSRRKFSESCAAQVQQAAVPDDDAVRRHARREQSFNDASDDGGARADVRPGRGENFDADHIVGGNERAPRLRHGGGASEIRDAAMDERAHDLGPGLESLGRSWVRNGDDARGGGGRERRSVKGRLSSRERWQIARDQGQKPSKQRVKTGVP